MKKSPKLSQKTVQKKQEFPKEIQESSSDSDNPKDENQKWAFVHESLKKIEGFQDSFMEIVEKVMKGNEVNFGMGAIFGAFMGDSLGSYCEFRIETIKDEDSELDTIMKMPGKGTWTIKPAQFTDDSELASHLLEALSQTYNPKQSFECQQDKILMKIAQEYVTWFKSGPFDIGNTTRKAFKLLKSNLYEMKIDREEKESQGVSSEEIQKDDYKKLYKTLEEIKQQNKNSLSNGSLMRISPMAFFISLLLQQKEFSQLTIIHFKKLIRAQISMTHGNEQILQSSFAWVELLNELILRKMNKRTVKEIYENFIEKYKNDEVIKEWIADSVSQQWLNAAEDQGWARVAFTFGIKTLKLLSQKKEEEYSEVNYKILIREIIKRVGDSDTNACIVGGLVGAVLGFKRLPIQYLEKQFALQLSENDKQCSFRSSFYEPRGQFYKAIKLMQKFQSVSSK